MRYSFLVLALAGLALTFGCKGSDTQENKKPPPKPALHDARVLFVIANQAFRDEELAEPKKAVEGLGAKVRIASKVEGICEGMMGAKVNADLALASVNMDEFDAVVFVGGGGASTFFEDPEAHAIAKAAASKKKLVAAICVAPTILAKAGLISGRDVTAFSSEQGILEEAGAKFRKKAVVFCTSGDFPLLTGADPYVAKEFGQALVKRLVEAKKAGKAQKKAPAKSAEGSGAKKEGSSSKEAPKGEGSSSK